MPRVFICYRREDSAFPAQMICEAVKSHFGDESAVFDVDTIPLGRDFRDYLSEQVSQCDVLLAVIGDRWLALLRERLDDQRDFVRFEIKAALDRKIPVVPVLVGRASVPSEKDLPSELADLAHRQAAEVSAGRDLRAHLRGLMEGLDATAKPAPRKKTTTARRSTPTTGEGAPTWDADEPLNRRIFIEGGEFLMGSPEGVGDDVEHPQHRVRISPLWIQEHPMTNEEYRRFVSSHKFESGRERHPVVKVNWAEAKAYAKWQGGDLPTEAQWEYAAGGKEGRTYPWGEEKPTCERANYTDCGRKLKAVGSHPIGATPEGVQDLAGNVWEWCRDWYGDYLPEEQTDPLGLQSGSARVLRGGSWGRAPVALRGATRNYAPPELRTGRIGFRVVWSSSGGLD